MRAPQRPHRVGAAFSAQRMAVIIRTQSYFLSVAFAMNMHASPFSFT